MYIKRVIIVLILVIITTALSFLAYSQVPQADLEKATRETDRPIREEVEEKLRVPPKKPPTVEEEEEEKEVEGEKFFVKRIELIGVESFDPSEFRPIIEEYENREVTLEELKTLARKIEKEYLKKGVIAACFIPPQDIKEGVVTLQVVEARMGELEVQDHKYFEKERISYYWGLKPGEILRYDKLSRSLQFINKNPDREARAALRAGKKPGTTDVSLSVDTSYPIHTTFSLDREGRSSTGNWRKGTGIKHNNFLGLDDTLLSGYLWGDHFWGIYAYHTLPITNVGTSLLYGFNYNKANPAGDYRLWDIDSRSKNISLFAHQDLYQKDKYLGDLYFGLDAKDRTLKYNTGVLNRDRLRILRTGGSFGYRDFDSVTYIKPELSQGIGFLGARRRDRLTTRNAKHIFTKLGVDIEHKKVLPANLQLSLKADGQLANTKLSTLEQFSLGGLDSVRGYPSGDFLADNALVTNVELLFPPFFIPDKVKLPYAARPLKEELTGVIFFDYGIGARRGRNKWTEGEMVELASVGAGLRIMLFNQALVRLEWGFPTDDREFFGKLGDKPSAGSPAGRLHFQVEFEDRLPQEIERINKLIEEENIEKFSWVLLDKELMRLESPLRERLYNYLYLAQSNYEEGDLEEAKEYYVRIFNICKSLYQQTETYIRGCLEHQRVLKEKNKLALEHYKEGELDEAKGLWQEIIDEASIKPLVLEL